MTATTSATTHRRVHRTALLTIVVAVVPVTLLVVAVTSRTWRDGVVVSIGLLASFLVLGQWRARRQRHFLATALGVSGVAWIASAAMTVNPMGFFGVTLVAGIAVAELARRPVVATAGVSAAVGAIGCLHLTRQPLSVEGVTAYVLIPGALTALVIGVVVLMERYWQIILDLEEAQRSEAELAVMRERMRFAGDLHDIQGHTLHVVKLKVSLAQELLTGNPERAAAELHEVHELVAETIRQTKELAAGQRRLNLSAELENARNLFEAAGITVRILREGRVGEEANELLGQVLREATTNILRHAQASEVRIVVSATGVAITNDGAEAGPLPTLIGLAVLRDRITAQGGTLSVTSESGSFSTSARIPNPQHGDGHGPADGARTGVAR